MPKKSLRDFIKEHRAELDAAITKATRRELRDNLQGFGPRLNDEERRQWILNDEGLYRWARSEGVRI